MKIMYKGIQFDHFTLEFKNGEVVDIDRDKLTQPLAELKGAWAYICRDCADKNNLDTTGMSEEMKDMACYVRDCSNISGNSHIVYSFLVDAEELEGISQVDLEQYVLNID